MSYSENARQKPENPLAFPHNGNGSGMTLRDYFAAAALQGLINTAPIMFDMEQVAKSAYKQADAMLKARGQS